MRRTVLLLAGVLLSAVALGSDSPKEYDDRVKADELEGTWRLTDIERNGEKRPTGRPCVKTFQSGICTFQWDDGDPKRVRYYIDTTRTPSHLDVDTDRGIYRIDGNMLRIAWRKDQQRPQGFKDNGVDAYIYKRVK
jgi:uncharacterized protein (TIGR03067 family)